MCCKHLGNTYSKCKASIKQRTAILQAFMQYKRYESYLAFIGQYYEHIKNVQKKKEKRKENQIHFI